MPKMPKIIATPSLPIPANQNDPVDRSEKLAYTVMEAASALGVGRSTLFDMSAPANSRRASCAAGPS